MGSTYQVNVEFSRKCLDYVFSKGIAYPSFILSPTFYIWIWIRPEYITQEALIWYLYGPLYIQYFLKTIQIRT